jgi:hypothetical protein
VVGITFGGFYKTETKRWFNTRWARWINCFTKHISHTNTRTYSLYIKPIHQQLSTGSWLFCRLILYHQLSACTIAPL